MKKLHIYSVLFLILFAGDIYSQAGKPQINSKKGAIAARNSGALTAVKASRLEAAAENYIMAARVKSLAPKHSAFKLTGSLKRQYSKKGLFSEKSRENSTQAAPQFSITKNFEGNPFLGAVPSDNHLAVSAGGETVSATNSGICIYDSNGGLISCKSLRQFHGLQELNANTYDPRVIYDSQYDRFIVLFLHGVTPQSSRLVLCFSAGASPSGDWHIYTIKTDINNDKLIFDFPNAAISNDELFVTGNMFTQQGSFRYPMIFQISKTQGYSGEENLQYQIWDNIKGVENNTPFALFPVSYGHYFNYGPGIYMVNTHYAQGDYIELFDITGNISSPNEQLLVYRIPTAPYEIGGDAPMKGSPDLLDVGDCRVSGGFFLGETIHFTFTSKFDENGFNGINYNRLNIISLANESRLYGSEGSDYCYSSTASFSLSEDSDAAIISFLRSASGAYPEIRVASLGEGFEFSNSMLVMEGLNAFESNGFPGASIRWGDYTCIVRKHNEAAPTAWLAGEWPNANGDRAAQIAEITAASLSAKDNSEEIIGLNISPIPAMEEISFEFNMPAAGNAAITAYDIAGRKIKQLYNGYAAQGLNRLAFNISGLQPGVYFIAVHSGSSVIFSGKFCVSGN